MQKRISSLALLGLIVILTNGCGKKVKLAPTIRSIKYTTATKHASFQIRKFSGIVYAVDYADMSFEDISGRVDKVLVDIGDKVKKGQILAIMKKERFELDVKEAEAALVKAEAQKVRANADYEREKELFKNDASFQQRLDARKFQYKSALSGVDSAKAKLGMAERNLRHTDLRAPYDGYIGERSIEPNQEVRPSQKIFRVDATGAMEVRLDIPENIIKRIKIGMGGEVNFSSFPDKTSRGKITFLGTAATRGNAFPAKIELIDPGKYIHPGMTAEVLLELPVTGRGKGFLLPISAVLPAPLPKTGYIFIYNPKTKRLKKVKIHTSGAVDNFGIVKGDISTGDIIATAGVSFLADKMQVTLFKKQAKQTDSVGE
ncbi:MAG: efflux RND transporter periplasmic adaptor subunit [Victivallaceae bacterium]|nr:efflux RND transporter periplasmic adaptor subunit [Victivallaceae bacterium]